ncbi:MAG: hypothetical protein K2J95_10300 [Lachnospiraceae bacterium]|nr:hypothetical protein [Lachnospiraceae bacterium]
MKEKESLIKKVDILLPVCLVLFSMIGCNQGADLSDTTYSLGNYLYFRELGGEWIYATFFANALGHFLMLLTGHRMLWMNVAGSILIAMTAIIVYYGFKNYVPRGVLFVGELMAVGLCWCPRVIFYNYLTYLVLTAAAVMLYHAILTRKKRLFLAAGILLGLNVFVRISNLTEMALILLVWYGAFLDRLSKLQDSAGGTKQQKDADWQKNIVWRQTGICIGGYLIGILAGLFLMILTAGADGYSRMLNWIFSLFTSSGEAGGYSMGEMLGTILKNYMGSLRWLLLMAAGIAAGMVMFSIKKERFLGLKKFFYLAGIVILGIYFYRNGVYDFRYYNNGSIFHLCVIFFLTEWILCILMMFHKRAGKEDKLLAALVMIVLLISPLGSNNHLFTCINNMFLLAPLGCFAGYRLYIFYRKGNRIFPYSAMGVVLAAGLLLQSVLFHCYFVFRDGVDGTPRDAVVTAEGNYYLAGMKTWQVHARAIEGLTAYAGGRFTGDEELILYGNLPGVAYLLHLPSALTTIWPDLESFPVSLFTEELERLAEDCDGGKKEWPVLVLSLETAAYATQDAEGMLMLGVDAEKMRSDEKLTALSEFIMAQGYCETYSNEEFVVLEKK